MIISDTIQYRADGSVSSVQRTTRHTFVKPSGAEATEDITAEVSLDQVGAHFAEAYAGMDAHNKTLEQQIQDEREATAAAHQQAMQRQAEAHTLAIDNAAKALTELEAEATKQIHAQATDIARLKDMVQKLTARAAQAEEKLAAIAAVAQQPAA